MTSLLRTLLALLFAAWLVTPGIGSDTEGGEDAGGTGIWILPAAAAIPADSLGDVDLVARASKGLPAVGNGVTLAIPSALDAAVAVLVSEVSGEVVPLDVSGSSVHVPQSALDALAATRTVAKLVITDAQQVGYVIVIEAERKDDSALTKVVIKVF